MTPAEARAKRRENALRKPIDAEDAHLQTEMDAVLAALIWKMENASPQPSPGTAPLA